MLFLWGDHVHILHVHVDNVAVQGDRIMGRPWLAAWGAQRVVQTHQLRCEIQDLRCSKLMQGSLFKAFKRFLYSSCLVKTHKF